MNQAVPKEGQVLSLKVKQQLAEYAAKFRAQKRALLVCGLLEPPLTPPGEFMPPILSQRTVYEEC